MLTDLYERHLLPHLIHMSCSSKPVTRQRQKIVPKAAGRVLEIGFGSGLNLPHYKSSGVELIWALEPAMGMRAKAKSNIEKSDLEVRWLDLDNGDIPLDTHAADCIVMTYTLCTITDWRLALSNMRRVVKPGGKLYFCEHGRAPDENVVRWQNRLNPIWQKCSGGCHLNRDIPALIRQGGFDIQQVETMYLPKTPKFAGFQIWGRAV